MAVRTGLEPATFRVTGGYSSRLSYRTTLRCVSFGNNKNNYTKQMIQSSNDDDLKNT